MLPVIRVDQLSKRFRIGGGGTRAQYRTLREACSEWMTAPFRRWRQGRAPQRDFWALQGVNFEVQPGEVVGILGRNGAGKSTLLKILSRITPPTSGRVELRGRVGSLLEVGTGFHPELTGRENILLNGSILGMTRREILRKFDTIVEFSGVEEFLDMPVKRYSSGMRVRLAFAVAAHLDPEMLLIDEVLAVGDAEFQQRCLGRMSTVAKSGRTVLFVSHNMTAVRNLCPRSIYIANGRIVQDGDSAAVISAYLSENASHKSAPEMDLQDWPARRGSGEVRIVHARLLNDRGEVTPQFYRLQPMTIEYTFESSSRAMLFLSAICCQQNDGVKVLQLAHQDAAGFHPGVVQGRKTVRIRIPALPLQCGEFQWTFGIHTSGLLPIEVVLDVLPFTVNDDLSVSPRPFRSTAQNGLCSLPADWQFLETTASSAFPGHALPVGG